MHRLTPNTVGPAKGPRPRPEKYRDIRLTPASVGFERTLSRERHMEEEIAMKEDAYDVVVVGGGAAGLSAALVLGRARRRVAVIDAGAPRNAPAAHVHGFLSRDGMPPADLLAEGRDEVTGYGVELVNDQVLGIEPGFAVRVAGGRTVTARRILMATGVSDGLPDVPGVRPRWGKDLLHCPYCHGWEVRDQPLGVLGALPGSAQHALLVRQWSGDVIFFVHTYDLMPAEQRQLVARGIRVVSGEVARLVVQDDRLTGVELTDGQVVTCTAVFVRPGNLPHDDGLLAGLGCERDVAGFPLVDGTGLTSVPGVWAAGNVADPRAQVITSAGAGSAAAIAINADLVQEDAERAIADQAARPFPAVMEAHVAAGILADRRPLSQRC
jgi:thioredoxin reductase